MSQHQRKVKSTLDRLDALTNVFLCGPFDNNQVSRVRVSPNSWINTNRPQFNPLEVHATVLTICYFQIVQFIMTRHHSFKVHSKIWFLNFKFWVFIWNDLSITCQDTKSSTIKVYWNRNHCYFAEISCIHVVSDLSFTVCSNIKIH